MPQVELYVRETSERMSYPCVLDGAGDATSCEEQQPAQRALSLEPRVQDVREDGAGRDVHRSLGEEGWYV